MADNRKETKESQSRWIFRDSMVEDLIEALEASKTEYEGRGLDFEGDLVKLYSELRKTMSEKYEETSCMFHVNIYADLKSCTGLM